jgi:uncharacterized protein YndB with AHSA1/START domain
MHLEYMTLIDAPIETVFRYQADPRVWREYIPAIIELRPVGTAELKVGSRWLQVDKMGPLHVRMTQQLVEFEPPHRAVWRTGAPYRAVEVTRCTEADGGTQVHVRFDAAPVGWLRALDLLPDRLLVRMSYQADLERLRTLLVGSGTEGVTRRPVLGHCCRRLTA